MKKGNPIPNPSLQEVDKLHQIARDIMAKLNEKYNITNEFSLDVDFQRMLMRYTHLRAEDLVERLR